MVKVLFPCVLIGLLKSVRDRTKITNKSINILLKSVVYGDNTALTWNLKLSKAAAHQHKSNPIGIPNEYKNIVDRILITIMMPSCLRWSV